MQIKLSIDEYNFLKDSIFLSTDWKNLIESLSQKNDDYFIIFISEDQSDELRDIFGEQLQLNGFDENYNPTPEGELLESLIDKFHQ